MKAILEFNLPEDNIEFRAASKAMDMVGFIFELLYNTKKELVYKANGDEVEEGIEMAFDKMHDLLNEYNINIEELS